MKSAYELALERSGGRLNDLPENIKQQISELDSICKSKLAAAEIAADQKLRKEEDPEKQEEIRQGLVSELASIREHYEHQKALVRKQS